MVGIEDILVWKELGIGAIAMVVFYKFASMVVINATKQMSQLHSDFLVAYKENTKALAELVAEFKEHINIKNHALELLEERHRQLEDKYSYLERIANRK